MYARTVYIVEIEQLGMMYIVQYKTRVAALNISAHGVYVHQSAVYIRKKTISIDNSMWHSLYPNGFFKLVIGAVFVPLSIWGRKIPAEQIFCVGCRNCYFCRIFCETRASQHSHVQDSMRNEENQKQNIKLYIHLQYSSLAWIHFISSSWKTEKVWAF